MRIKEMLIMPMKGNKKHKAYILICFLKTYVDCRARKDIEGHTHARK